VRNETWSTKGGKRRTNVTVFQVTKEQRQEKKVKQEGGMAGARSGWKSGLQDDIDWRVGLSGERGGKGKLGP